MNSFVVYGQSLGDNQALQQLERISRQGANNRSNNNNQSLSITERLRNLQRRRSGQSTTEDTAQTAPETKRNTPTAAETLAAQQKSLAMSQSTEEAIDEAAFNSMMKSVFPLTPEQILRIRARHEETERASSRTASKPPKPTATSQIVRLAPGSTPPVIRLAQGFVTSLVFIDSTGADWPIAAYDLGNPKAFNIQWDKKSNTMMVQASSLYTYGNLAVRLRDLSTPVMLTLIPGQSAVDYRVDLRVQGYGPNAQRMPMTTGLPASANALLLSVLDGIPPTLSKELKIIGADDAQVWLLGDKLYLRTRLTVISPGWLATMSSADGMHVYEMQKTPLVLVSEHGKVMQLKIQGL